MPVSGGAAVRLDRHVRKDLMKIYDPSNPDDVRACIAEVDAYLESHRIEPYEPDEIKALSGQRIAEVKLPVKIPCTAPCERREGE